MAIRMDQGLTELLDQLNTSVRACWTTLWVHDPGGERLVLSASAGVEQQDPPEQLTGSDDPAAVAFRSGETVFIGGSSTLPPNIHKGKDTVTGSSMHIPVRHQERVLGVLSIGTENAGAFSPEAASILTAYLQALGAWLGSQVILDSEHAELAAEIVGRKAAESDLRHSESLVSALIAQSPHMVFISRLDDFHFVDVNDRACQYYGYSREEFLEMEIFDIEIEPPLRERVRALYDSTPIGEEVEVYGTNKKKDGTTFPVHVRFGKLNDELAVANVRDISDVQHAEASLRDSEARSAALLEDAPQGIIVADSDGVMIRVNRRLESLFGYSRDELVGKQVEILIPESSKPKHVSLRSGYAANPVSRTMGEGLRLSGLRKDGSEFPVDIALSGIDSSEGRLIIAHVMDDTNRRALEEVLRESEEQLGSELVAREAELSFADQVAENITSALDISQVLTNFADESKDLIDFDHAAIALIDHETETLTVNRYLRFEPLEAERQIILDLKGSQTEEICQTGQTIIKNDLSRQPAYSSDGYLVEAGLRSSILIPLYYDEVIVGTLLLASSKREAFGVREQRILERLARQLAPAVENARLYGESVSRTAQLECLLSMAEILGQSIPFEEKVSQVLEQLVEVSEGRSAHFRVPSASGDQLIIAASAGMPDDPRITRPASMGEGTLVYQAYKQGESLIVHDLLDHPAASPYSIDRGDRSAAFLPVGQGPTPIAVVAVDSDKANHFTLGRVRLLTAIGEGLGTLLENSQLSDELRSSTQEMALVDQVADIITSSLDIDQVFVEFGNEISSLVDFDFAAINNVDPEAGKINQHCLWTGPNSTSVRIQWDLEGSQTELVMATGQTIVQTDLSDLPRFSSNEYFHGQGLRSTVLSPLIYNDRVIGSISLGSNCPEAYGLRERRILERLARQIAPAVENSRLYEDSVSRTAQLECMVNLAGTLGQAIPFEEKVSQAMEQLVEMADGYAAHLRMPDAAGKGLVLAASAGGPDDPRFSRPMRLEQGSLTFDVFLSGQPRIINDYHSEPKAIPDFIANGDRSIALLPIGIGSQTVAVLTVVSNQLNHFTPGRVRFLMAVGEGLGTFLENDRLGFELQSRILEMEVVDQISKIITTTLDIDQVLSDFAGELRNLVDFRFFSINIIDRGKMTYDSKNYIWGDSLEVESRLENHLEGSQTELVMRTSKTVIEGDVAKASSFRTARFFLERGLSSLAVVPLIYGDVVLGTIIVGAGQKDAYGDREQLILERLASHITPAIENARQYQEAQERTNEIQRLNEASNRILASNPSSLAVLRGTGREVVSINESFCSAFGIDKDQTVGQLLSETIDWVGLEECIAESLSTPRSDGDREARYLAGNGVERWFSVSAVPLLAEDESETQDEILLVLNDITERKAQQERIQEQSRLASVGELASGVAHEINNPLAAIHGISELLQMDNWPDQVSEDARKIQEAAQRAAKVVQNLLFFARKSQPEKRYLDLAAVVGRALDLKARDFELKNISVFLNHSEDLVSTMMDEPQLIQVILNVLTNAEQAIKAQADAGNITITTDRTNDVLRLRISDDGPGIPAENLHSIFNPFFTTKDVGEGTGLGLSICYGIIREHGGEMWVESEPGEGATFCVELPVLPEVTPTHVESDAPDERSTFGQRILVVDDEPEVRLILERVLTNEGHSVALAPEGESAWALIQENQYDKIFLDLRMPGMDGQSFYYMLAEYSLEQAQKVVFVTGDTASTEARRFLDSTGRPVLSKPFGVEAIRQLL